MSVETGPQAHSAVGSSTAHRVMACPASLVLTRDLPPSPDSPSSEMGTQLHAMMELGTTTPHDGLSPLARTNLGKYAGLMEDVIATIAAYEADPDCIVLKEVTLPFPGIPGAFGTGDVLIYEKSIKRLTYLDHKFGVKIVGPKAPQFAYGLVAGTWHLQELGHMVEAFRTIVFQPADFEAPIKSATDWTTDELDAFQSELQQAVEAAETSEPVKGDHCTFCRAMIRCPRYTRVVDQAKIVAASPAARAGRLSPQDVAAALRDVDTLEEWVKSVKDMRDAFMAQDPKSVPGWDMGTGRGSRAWADEATPERLLGAARAWTKELVSPAEAERILSRKLTKKDGVVSTPGKPSPKYVGEALSTEPTALETLAAMLKVSRK